MRGPRTYEICICLSLNMSWTLHISLPPLASHFYFSLFTSLPSSSGLSAAPGPRLPLRLGLFLSAVSRRRGGFSSSHQRCALSGRQTRGGVWWSGSHTGCFFFFCICYPLRPTLLCVFFFFFASVRARLFALQIEQLARTVFTDQLKTLRRCGIFGWAASRVADKRGHHRFVRGFTCSVCVCVCGWEVGGAGGGTVLWFTAQSRVTVIWLQCWGCQCAGRSRVKDLFSWCNNHPPAGLQSPNQLIHGEEFSFITFQLFVGKNPIRCWRFTEVFFFFLRLQRPQIKQKPPTDMNEISTFQELQFLTKLGIENKAICVWLISFSLLRLLSTCMCLSLLARLQSTPAAQKCISNVPSVETLL